MGHRELLDGALDVEMIFESVGDGVFYLRCSRKKFLKGRSRSPRWTTGWRHC